MIEREESLKSMTTKDELKKDSIRHVCVLGLPVLELYLREERLRGFHPTQRTIGN